MNDILSSLDHLISSISQQKLLKFPDFPILIPNILLAAAKISVLQLKMQLCFLPDSPYKILPVQNNKETPSFQGD